jgi:hypothetical protein
MQIQIDTSKAVLVWSVQDCPPFFRRQISPDDLDWIVFVPAGVQAPDWISLLAPCEARTTIHDPAWGTLIGCYHA